MDAVASRDLHPNPIQPNYQGECGKVPDVHTHNRIPGYKGPLILSKEEWLL